MRAGDSGRDSPFSDLSRIDLEVFSLGRHSAKVVPIDAPAPGDAGGRPASLPSVIQRLFSGAKPLFAKKELPRTPPSLHAADASISWREAVEHDRASRAAIIEQMGSPQAYSDDEERAIGRGLALLDLFASDHEMAAKQSHATLGRQRMKMDSETHRLAGWSEAIIRGAKPEDIVAFLMDYNRSLGPA